MKNLSSEKLIVLISLTLALAIVLLSAAFVPGLRPRDWLLRRWRRELPQLDAAGQRDRLRQMLQLGDEGIHTVAMYLGASDKALATGAEHTLHEALDRWQLAPANESSPKAASLAHSLAASARQFSPKARQPAAGLAARLLLWPVDQRHLDCDQFLLDCQTTLRWRRLAAPPTPQIVSSTKEKGSLRGQLVLWESPLDPAFELPGGGLPIEIVNPPSLPLAETATPLIDETHKPRRLDLSPAEPPKPLAPASTLSFP